MEKQLIQFCETKLLNEQKYSIKKDRGMEKY